jgi:riboflavin kinase/FMN adenylyltransferase
MNTLYFPPTPSDARAATAPLSRGHAFAATIGFFDGVHRGHRSVIEQLKQAATRHGLQTMVVTFDRHPRQVIQSEWQPQLLTSLEEKARLLEETGIDVLVVLRFDSQMAALSACAFMQQVLRDQLGVRLLLTGYDNRFGHNREEGFDDYRRYGREMGMEVVCGEPCGEGELRFSSSLTRRLLSEGRVEEAALCLGRPYSVTGRVVHGEQIGRTLGFPTANIVPADACRLVPANGVYAVNAVLENDPVPHPAVMNIGLRPTFDGHQQTLEAHLLDYKGNLYGRQITVSFMARLRPEQHFGSPQALASQMAIDAQQARQLLTLKPETL